MTSNRASCFAPRPGRAGLTLVEVLVAVAIVALLAGAATLGLGATNRAQLRAACMKLVAASRYAAARASAQGSTVRIALDLSAGTIALQEARGRVTLTRADDERRGDEEEDPEAARSAADPWEAAKARLEKTLQPNLGRDPFGPLTGRDGEVLRRFEPRPLGRGVRIVKLYAPHEPHPRQEGIGYVYFFPSGVAEHAVVQLASGETVYSVEFHPFGGRARVHRKPVEPQTLEEGDLEEPS